MKKYIILLSIMLFAHDVMFGSKKQVSSLSSSKKEEKKSVFQIEEDANWYFAIFRNFMKISAPGKKIKMSKNSKVSFENIWKLCIDENKKINPKKKCKAKSVLYTYIYKEIKKLKKVFESEMIEYLNEKVGKNRYTKNTLFSDEGLFKTKSFIDYIITDENLNLKKEAKDLFGKIEKAHENICKYQRIIENLYKKSGNEKEDSDDELGREIFEMNLNVDNCNVKKEKKILFRKKIEEEITNIFNDKTRREKFFLKKAEFEEKHKKVKAKFEEKHKMVKYVINLNYFENLNNNPEENKPEETKHNNSIKNSSCIEKTDFLDDILHGISGVEEIDSFEKEKNL